MNEQRVKSTPLTSDVIFFITPIKKTRAVDQVGQHYPAFWPRFLTWMTDWRGGWHHQWCLQRQKKKKEEDPQPQLRTQRIDLWQKRSALKGVKEWRVELKQPVCRHVLNSEKIKCVREKTCKGRRPLFTPRCHPDDSDHVSPHWGKKVQIIA